jgi:two-component system NarL family sensor kinase
VTKMMGKVRLLEQYAQVIESGRTVEKISSFPAPWRHAKWRGPKQLHYQIRRLGDGVLVTVRDVTAQKRAESALRALPRHISQAQEAERRRVARELHDGLNQLLVAARLRLREALRLAGNTPDRTLVQHVERAEVALGQAVNEVGRISRALRPRQLDDMGLAAALSNLFADSQERSGMRIDYRSTKSLGDLPTGVAESLYRIAQEALTNIERHAHARRVRVRLHHTPKTLTLTMADDGRGMLLPDRESAAGLGLLHMRERAESAGGSLLLSTRHGLGTEIQVEIPLAKRKSKTRRHGRR